MSSYGLAHWSHMWNENGGCKFRNCIMQNERGVRANNAQQAFFAKFRLNEASDGITSFVDINYKRGVHVPLKRDN